jgi:hypothetical protein
MSIFGLVIFVIIVFAACYTCQFGTRRENLPDEIKKLL